MGLAPSRPIAHPLSVVRGPGLCPQPPALMVRGHSNFTLRVAFGFRAAGTVLGTSALQQPTWELTRRLRSNQRPLTEPTRAFVEFHIGEGELLQAEAGLI
jgi:hypothetical protein